MPRSSLKTRLSSVLLATLTVVSPVGVSVTSGQAAQIASSYCFRDSNKVNVLAGNPRHGFYAYPAGRRGNSLYYQRVGNTNRYVGETGAIYTLFRNGTATWSDGRRMIHLYRCG